MRFWKKISPYWPPKLTVKVVCVLVNVVSVDDVIVRLALVVDRLNELLVSETDVVADNELVELVCDTVVVIDKLVVVVG